MRVMLIIPPSPFLLDEKVFINLGILRVAASLCEKGVDVHIADLSGKENYLELLIEQISTHKPLAIGITSTTQQFPYVCRISEKVRDVYPIMPQIIGGSHPTLVYSSLKRKQQRSEKNWQELQKRFDVIVAGDGELAIFEALEMVKNRINGIVDSDKTSSSLFLTNLKFESLPFPARNLLDMDSYEYYIAGKRATSIVAQLGCPFACGFCSGRSSPMLRKIRLRSDESVVSEIKKIHSDYGYGGYMFYDDELNVNPSMIQLMNRLINLREEFDFSYRGCIKSELFTAEQAKKMKDAGFDEILVGFESGDDRILTNINKKAKLEDNERCVELARRYGIKVKFLMSIGHPGETPETCQKTLDWLLKMRPDYFNVTIITCTPGMFYYDYATKTNEGWTYTCQNGDRLHSQDLDYTQISDYYNGVPGEYNSFVHTDALSSHDLILWRDHIEFTVRSRHSIPYPNKTERSYDKTIGQ